MAEPLYPNSSRDLSETRRALAPDTEKAFQAFSQNVFVDGALSAKTKQLITVQWPTSLSAPIASEDTRKPRSAMA
jgi:hypothetical protein